MPPPLTYAVSARASAGKSTTVHAGTVDIDVDANWAHPPTGEPGPADLLASAFAVCLLKNLARTGDMLGFEYDDASVEVIVRRQDSPPRFTEITYSMMVTSREPQRRVDLVHQNLRKFGTVYNTLAAVCEVHGDVVARDPDKPSPNRHDGHLGVPAT